MFKRKTSVLFVDTKGKENRLLQIPTKVLLHWKKFALVMTCFVFFLMGSIAYLVYHRTSNLYQEKLSKANRIKNMIDLEKMQKSFQSIDENMYKINQFLEKRGLKKINFDNVGGLPSDGIKLTNVDEHSEFYRKYVENIAEKIKKVPMGVPHRGRITSKFGYRHNPFTGKSSEHHSGIDFKGNYGSRINATADGKVFFAGVKGGYGNCVILQHDNGIKTLYAHMKSIVVKKGQKINLGDKVGELGNTGRSTGPHLHYEIMLNDEKIDPQPFLKL